MIKFSDHKDFNSFEVAMNGLSHVGGGTRIDRALENALQKMFTTENGMRTTSTKTAVLITDGGNNKRMDSSSFKKRFKARNIKLIAVGAGNVNKRELEKLVDNPSDLHIASNMDALKRGAFFKGIGKSLCNGRYLRIFIQ